jgi:hypothetical protein
MEGYAVPDPLVAPVIRNTEVRIKVSKKNNRYVFMNV